MAGERLGERLGIDEELIKISCKLSLTYKPHHYHVDHSSSEKAIFFVFTGLWTGREWYSGDRWRSGDKPFGETKLDPKEWSGKNFPSLRSIGNDEVAVVNKAFLARFELVCKDPNFLQQVGIALHGQNSQKQIIFTGHSAGGAVAALATIWFLEQYSKTNINAPKCVTFGSALVGDSIVSHALRRENWSRNFIHFVMRYDIAPRILLAPLSSIQEEIEHILHNFTAGNHHFPRGTIPEDFYTSVRRNASALASHAACRHMGSTNLLLETIPNFIELSPYRPFGTYIFCTGNGKLVYLDNPEAVLQLLFYSCQLSNESEMKIVAASCINSHLGYENELCEEGSLDMQIVLYLDQLAQLSLVSDGTALDDLGLSTRGKLCLRAAGEFEKQKQMNQEHIKKKQAETEKAMKGLQEYKTFYESKVGYYDAFKRQNDKRDFDANVNRQVLAGIWDGIKEMLKMYDLPDEFEGESYWIELGTKFRRLVEPLDIANYYRHAKNEDTGAYMLKGRPRRYRYLQRWLEKREGLAKDSCGESCFWAEVEELLKLASNGGKVEAARAVKLQEDMAKWIQCQLIGKDVFLEESTFMKLWEEFGRLKLQHDCIRQLMN